MRTANSLKNINFTILSTVILSVLSFITRRVFLDTLGSVYLGLMSLFSNIISMLSIVELGIGMAILYSLYKPLAEDNKPEVVALVNLYAKLYRILALAVALIGISIGLFLKYFVKEEIDISFVYIIYSLYLIDVVASYFFSHKRTLLFADQKAYVTVIIDSIIRILITVLQLFILIYLKNFVLYLLCEFSLRIVNNIIVNHIVNLRYPYLKTIEPTQISVEHKNDIIKNTKALFYHKIGEFVVKGTDNIVISYFLNLKIVGFYSNYYIIITLFTEVLQKMFNSIVASMGNFLVIEEKKRSEEIFSVIYFANFWVASLTAMGMFNMLNPLISLWIGKQYIIDELTFSVLILNYYLTTMRFSITVVKSSAGIYHADRYAPLAESLINLVFSIILVQKIGLAGVFIGTAISSVLVPFWIRPFMVYKYVFQKSTTGYFVKYIGYFTIGLAVLLISNYFTKMLMPEYTIKSFIIGVVFNGIFINAIYIILFFKKKEFKYVWDNLVLKKRKCKN